MLKNNLIILFVLVVSTELFSSEMTDTTWSKLLETYKIPYSDQSYCYTSDLNQVEGTNQDIQIRLASVSKLLTSLWATEKVGLMYKYKTKLYINGNNLHIVGSSDPFFGNEKMFFILSRLNGLGYRKFDNVTFDKYIQINPNVQIPSNEYPLITRATNARNIKMYFNTNNWSSALRAEYSRLANADPGGNFRKDVTFEVGEAQYVDHNPYEKMSDTKIFTLSSPELYKYLKEMNVYSNNYAAQTVFLRLGGSQEFEKYLLDRFKLTSDSIHLYNGSGLPEMVEGIRRDNYATCAIVIKLIAQLKYLADRQGKELKDIIAVPGSDTGTFINRSFPTNYKNSFVAKTGTLVHTSTLAGAMSTKNGYSFFGIFNQSRDTESSKIVQNSMVQSIMTDIGGPLVFKYEVSPFRSFNTFEEEHLHQFF
jgi:D-alanyl-D-alanine carboxypeptidase/D-alanyl-D-alanine-endopeptidase (penicillin-binding protein 4)